MPEDILKVGRKTPIRLKWQLEYQRNIPVHVFLYMTPKGIKFEKNEILYSQPAIINVRINSIPLDVQDIILQLLVSQTSRDKFDATQIMSTVQLKIIKGNYHSGRFRNTQLHLFVVRIKQTQTKN